MIRRGLVAVALAASIAGCGSNAPDIGAQLAGPTDVVPFRGVTVNSPEARQYLAVASGRGNELRLVDLTSDRAVLGPSVVFPLSIPSEPRPMRVAAASLGDGGADLLVASSAGSGTIELVLTWAEQNRIVDVYDFAAEGAAVGSAEVLSMAAAPVPGAPGQARVIAALSGGRLVVVTATRGTDGAIALVRPPVVRDVGFDAVDLAVVESRAPATAGLWLFAATADDLDPDPATELFGVVQMQIAGDPTTWAPVALEARGPTRLVAAADVAERVSTDARPDTFEPESPLRVYAALDPTGCGLDRPMDCGVVTLDPLTLTLAADPARELDHRAPMPINGVPLDLTIATQPAQPAPQVCNENWDPSDPDIEQPLYPNARLLIAPGTGQRCTSAIAAVSSSDGFVYLFDLGRWGAPNEASILRGVSRVRVQAVTEVRPVVDPAIDTAPLLALWEGDEPSSILSVSQREQADFAKWFTFWPGYTPTERFHLGWKIAVPSFVSRGGVIGRLDDGSVFIAAQADTGGVDTAGRTVWALGPKLGDPANGVHVGDTLVLATTADGTCAPDQNGVFPGSTVAAVLPPDPVRFPGGAVVLAPVTDPAGQPVASCWDTAIAQSATGLAAVSFTIRASGHLIYGERLGYLGRPEKDVRFTLAWQDEANPLLSPEERAITRKLRRFYYPGADKCDATTICPDLGSVNPVAPGPALSFRLGWLGSASRTGSEPIAGEQLLIDTQSGIAPMARKPLGAGALPLGIAPVDRSTFIAPGDVVRFYVAYQDNQVFVFSPGESLAQTFSIR